MTEQEQCVINDKIMGNLGKNAGIRGHNTIFFPLSPSSFNCHAKRVPKSNWGKIYDILSLCVFIFPT
jgi:hypothetical protein